MAAAVCLSRVVRDAAPPHSCCQRLCMRANEMDLTQAAGAVAFAFSLTALSAKDPARADHAFVSGLATLQEGSSTIPVVLKETDKLLQFALADRVHCRSCGWHSWLPPTLVRGLRWCGLCKMPLFREWRWCIGYMHIIAFRKLMKLHWQQSFRVPAGGVQIPAHSVTGEHGRLCSLVPHQAKHLAGHMCCLWHDRILIAMIII